MNRPIPVQRPRFALASTRYAGFTIVEVLVVVSILILLVGILVPSLTRARQYSQSGKCVANLNGIGKALVMYYTDNKGRIPFATKGNPGAPNVQSWYECVRDSYGIPWDKLLCPSRSGTDLCWNPSTFAWDSYNVPGDDLKRLDYSANSLIMARYDKWQPSGSVKPTWQSIDKVKAPSLVFAISEGKPESAGDGTEYSNWLGGWAPGNGVIFRHMGGAPKPSAVMNLVYFDGHTESLALGDSDKPPKQMIWRTGVGSYANYPWSDPP